MATGACCYWRHDSLGLDLFLCFPFFSSFRRSALSDDSRLLKRNVAVIRLGCWRFQSGTVGCYDVFGIAAVFFSILRGHNVAARLVVGFFDCCRLPMLVTVDLDSNILIWIELFTVPDSVVLVVAFRVCLFVVLIFFANERGVGPARFQR